MRTTAVENARQLLHEAEKGKQLVQDLVFTLEARKSGNK